MGYLTSLLLLTKIVAIRPDRRRGRAKGRAPKHAALHVHIQSISRFRETMKPSVEVEKFSEALPLRWNESAIGAGDDALHTQLSVKCSNGGMAPILLQIDQDCLALATMTKRAIEFTGTLIPMAVARQQIID